MVAIIDMLGSIWGTQEVLGRVDTPVKRRAKWRCRCTKCGAEKEIYGTDIRRHSSEKGCRSCHSRTARHTHTDEYNHWCEMRTRVTNKNRPYFDKYSALGMDESWKNSFDAFIAHIGPRPSPEHTVDRIDNNVGYYPGNVRWATRKEQARNTSRNIWVWVNGVKMILADAAPLLQIPYNTLRDWAHDGRNK